MTVYFEDEADISFDFDPSRQLDQVISFVKEYVGCPYDVEVSVTLVDKPSIQEINAQHRGIDRPTDVLSFPMMEYDEPADFDGPAFRSTIAMSPDKNELMLGDIVLCSHIVREQAEDYGHSELREFTFLIVHSMLHLFGFDHISESDRILMEEEQREIMKRLGIDRT